MTPHDLTELIAARLNAHDVRYFVTGSIAAMAYGEPRTTRDVDIVISAGPRDVAGILAALSIADVYLDPDAVRQAVETFGPFNIVHSPSGYKVDFRAVDEDRYDASRFSRRREIVFQTVPIWVAAPEDVILKKLQYYREGQSDKHLRDIASIFKVSGDKLDRQYLDHWALRLDVAGLWRYVVARAEGSEPGPTV